MALAGYGVEVSVATTASGTYYAFDGIKEFTIGDGTDMLDITDFADSRLRRRIAGLRDPSMTLGGDVEVSDSGFQAARAAYNAGTALIVRVIVNTSGSTDGSAYSMLLESFERSASVDGKVELSTSLAHEGTLSPITIGNGL